MTPSHANKGSRRYRYYNSRIQGADDGEPVWRVPAGDLEELVIGRLCAFLSDEGAVYGAISNLSPDGVTVEGALLAAGRLARQIELASPTERGQLISSLLTRVTVATDKVILDIDRAALLSDASKTKADYTSFCLEIPARLARVGNAVKLVVAPDQSRQSQQRDPALIKLVVKAHGARMAIEREPDRSVAELANANGNARHYFGVLLRLAYLAPDIVEAILDGRQPPTLTRQKLARFKGLAHDWQEQRQRLNFDFR